ncbi:MAG: DUF4287 domain-containing protein [Caulobacteraceae bacterium]|nr:DUF4287 domain-containing protein [Caulobacteraceae bacterium]
MTTPNLTPRQQKWFASVRAGLERDTGKSLETWVEIAKSCPETSHRARLQWLKEHHGLLQNRASQVLGEAFGSIVAWNDPDALISTLWVDPTSCAIFEAVDAAALALPGAIRTARKGYTAWSRQVQFAAARPMKGGKAMLGLAVTPYADSGLEAPKSESWSERLKSRRRLEAPADVDETIRTLLRTAWERS